MFSSKSFFWKTINGLEAQIFIVCKISIGATFYLIAKRNKVLPGMAARHSQFKKYKVAFTFWNSKLLAKLSEIPFRATQQMF